MPGRKPKPTAIKQLHGNPGKRALNKNEPQFSGLPVCPSWLPDPAKTEWKRTVALMAELDMLKGTDQAALAAYCLNWHRWMTAEKVVTKEGQTFKHPILDKTGTVVGHKITRHPSTIIAKDACAAMLKAAALFGFDPSSRSRIQLPEQKEPTEHDNFEDELYAAPADTSGVVH